ncbi:MAG: peptidoglycan DD-metalloendopeptidase family protein [Pseudomonadota bacterium]
MVAVAAEARVTSLYAALQSAEMKQLETARRRAEATHRLSATHRELAATRSALAETEAALASLQHSEDEAERERRRLAAAVDAAEAEVTSLRMALIDAESRSSGGDGAMGTIGNAIDRVIAERDFALAKNAAMAEQLVTLEYDKKAIAARETQLLEDLKTMADSGLSGLETMFDRANIDVDDLLARISADYSGKGGPFTELQLANADASYGEDARMTELLADLERLSVMQFAAQRVPFAKPVRGARMTSGFGPRRDPFRKRRSMHNGVDWAGPRGTPIEATASGVVTFVGRQRGFGIVVEIRHAFGFETLYAHLNKARVTLGQRVEKGDRIGDMGSTGRSTGVHVHYEVRLNNRPVNPMTFIEAARDVL